MLCGQIMGHNLAPALEWAAQHRAELVASSGEQAVSTFQFRLHRLQFLHLLQTEGARGALDGTTPEHSENAG